MGTFIGSVAASSTVGTPAPAWATVGSFANLDIAVAFVFHSSASTVTTPSGWTAIANFNSSGSEYCDVFTKTMSGSESGTQTFTTSTSAKANALIEVHRGVVQPTSAEVSSFGVTAADTAQSKAVPALAHSGTIRWVTAMGTRNSTPPTTITAPAGCAASTTTFTTGGGSNCAGVTHSTATENDGNVGSGNWTHNTASAVDWVAVTVAMVDAVTRVVKTQATTWNVAARVTKTTATTYDVRARVPKTVATTWNARARVAKTTATTWDARARVAKTTATTWDVAGALSRISKTTATTWNTLARVAKTQATTWDVAGALTRISKTTATTWTVRARVAKTQSTTWDTRARVAKTQATTWTVRARLAKTLATTWNIASMISEATWPAFIGHRGTDPGPEETMFAYDTLYARSPNYWHEGDGQALSDGTTMVANHDDDVDRMYSSGPVATGNVTSISPTNWALEKWRPNTGFTGPDQFALKLLDWVAKYGFNPTAGPAIGLWEVKTGTSAAQMATTFANCKGTVVLNCNNLTDAQTVRAAGFDACLQTDTPTFSQFTSNGIKYLSINYTAMTGTIATNAIAAGVKVLMYTVNSTANRDSMLALFSDTSFAGFISNKPQTLAGTTRVAKTTATTWQVRARVPKATATTWNLRSRVTKTQSATWDVAGALTRVSKTVATTWNTRQRVAKAVATTYDVRARATKTTSSSWDTRARLVKTTPTSWDVRARATKTTGTTWDLAARVAKAQGTTWDVRQRVVSTRSTTWDVAFLVPAGDGAAVERPVLILSTRQAALTLTTEQAALEVTTDQPTLNLTGAS